MSRESDLTPFGCDSLRWQQVRRNQPEEDLHSFVLPAIKPNCSVQKGADHSRTY